MVRRTGGMRRKSRHKFEKYYKRRGKISVSRFFQSFVVGDHVTLLAEPAYQKSMYKGRFHGKSGTISGQQGSCYKVTITDGDKAKVLLLHPVHLQKLVTHG